MQSLILVAIGLLLLIYMTMQDIKVLSNSSSNYEQLKISNLATNIILYENIVAGYLIQNQLNLRLNSTINSNTVEKITVLDNAVINNNLEKQTNNLFDYKSISFNYVSMIPGMSEYYPNYYMASSWNQLAANLKGYKDINLPAVMGTLSNKLSSTNFQGDSLYWNIPWVFEQADCQVIRMYSQLVTSSDGYNRYQQVKKFFNTICLQVEEKSSYRFGRYVYLQAITTSSKY